MTENIPPLDLAGLRRLVDAFYVDVCHDDLLGPVFAAVIQDWEPHLQRMTEFWSTVMLSTRSFRGNLYQKHVGFFQQFARFIVRDGVAVDYVAV